MSVATANRDLEKVQAEIDSVRLKLFELEGQALKIAHYIEMSGVYDGPSEITSVDSRGEHASPRLGSRIPLNGKTPKNVRTVIEILNERRHPVKTKDLVEELAKRGIAVGGKIPVTNLSSALSRFKETLKSDRSEGWSLRDWENSNSASTEPKECLENAVSPNDMHSNVKDAPYLENPPFVRRRSRLTPQV